MAKSIKVKIILIITFLSLSAIIMTYRYFTQFKQTQIDTKEEPSSLDKATDQFEFASSPKAEDFFEENIKTFEEEAEPLSNFVSKIDLGPNTFLEVSYSTYPVLLNEDSQEITQKMEAYKQEPVLRNFVQDMNKALKEDSIDFYNLPSWQELQKGLASTQTQKILLQYSKDPEFNKLMQQIIADPAFTTGFINYIQNKKEPTRSK